MLICLHHDVDEVEAVSLDGNMIFRRLRLGIHILCQNYSLDGCMLYAEVFSEFVAHNLHKILVFFDASLQCQDLLVFLLDPFLQLDDFLPGLLLFHPPPFCLSPQLGLEG